MSAPAGRSYTMEVRLILCPHCGAPLDVSVGGGAVRCSFCAAESQVSARTRLPAFAPHPPASIPEDERLRRLRAQDQQPLLPPAGIAALFGPGGVIPAHRQQDGLAAWQSARKRTAEQSLEAAAELLFLTIMLSNQFVKAKDWTRHRAMHESALEAFFLPRHRTSMASALCCGACREGDLGGAETWLAMCDPASDDLMADSDYRIARARVARLQQDFRGVVAVLGETAADVPIHDAIDGRAVVERANAWERLGRVDLAVRELGAQMAKGPDLRASVELIVGVHELCPQSFPQALAATQARSAELAARTASGGLDRNVTIGKLLLVLGALGLAVAVLGLVRLKGFPSEQWEGSGGIMLMVGGGVGGMLVLVGLVVLGLGRPLRAEAEKARRLALHGKRARGTVLSVENTGLLEGSQVQVRLRLRVERDGAAPYEAESKLILPPEQLGDVATGNVIFLRVNPDDPSEVGPEA